MDLYIKEFELDNLPVLFQNKNHKEGKFYLYNDYLVKSFENVFNIDYHYLKIKTINALLKRNIEIATVPKGSFLVNHLWLGYYMDYLSPTEKWCDLEDYEYKSITEQINILKNISTMIEYLHKDEDIIITDLRWSNIMINNDTLEMRFCDFDSVVVDDIPSCIYGERLCHNDNLTRDIIQSKKADILAYNFMIMEDTLLISQSMINHLKVNQYEDYIDSLFLPSSFKKLFKNLYKEFFNENSKLLYPHQYLDDIGDYLIKQKCQVRKKR